MKNLSTVIFCICFILFLSCDEEIKGPLNKDDFVPKPPTNIRVENKEGASTISYNIADDSEILYVMAVFLSNDGEEKIIKSSIFKNKIVLEGFGKSKEHNVQLYTVSRTEKRSKPVNVTIHPLDAPILDVFKSIKIESTFGGINIDLKNEIGNEYTLFTIVKDSTSNWVESDRLYFSSKKNNHSVRGFDTIPQEFGVYIMDKWRNSSDTLFKKIKPLFETEFDRELFSDANLMDDSNASAPGLGPLSRFWREGLKVYFFMDPNMPGLTLPNWITIDLGRKYIFGRMLLGVIHVSDRRTYSLGTPKKFEIWGSNEKTTDWTEWTLLGEFEVIKPSGLPIGQLTEEDRAKAAAGHEFDFPFQQNAFRYMRFKTVSTFGGNIDVHLQEIRLWGQPLND